MGERLVEVKDLHIGYRTFEGYTSVLNGMNCHIDKGEKVAIVGETGCGKTTTVKAILRILVRQARINGGEIIFDGKDVLKMGKAELSGLRGAGISMIFQDPMLALNPVFTVGSQMSAVIRYSGEAGAKKKEVQQDLAVKALRETSLPDPRLRRSGVAEPCSEVCCCQLLFVAVLPSS